MKLSTTQEFIIKSKKIFGDSFDYSKVNYINSKILVKLICHKHGEFYLRPSVHISYKTGCPYCSGFKLNLNDFIQRANIIHNNKYNYDKTDLKSVKEKVIIICPIHGEFKQMPDKHINAKQGCNKCNKACKKDINNIIERANIIHDNKYDYSKITLINMFNKVEIICQKHGSFWQTPTNHINHKQKCPKCYHENKLFTLEHFIYKANQIHKNEYDYSNTKYTGSLNKIEIICKKHGSFLQTANSHLCGAKCPKCTKHISDKEILWLNSLNITNEKRQKTIFANNKFFKVDAFDSSNNTIYEFYGDYWHGNPKKYNQEYVNKHNKKKFKDLYDATTIREKQLISLGYKIISIWESDFDSIKNEKV